MVWWVSGVSKIMTAVYSVSMDVTIALGLSAEIPLFIRAIPPITSSTAAAAAASSGRNGTNRRNRGSESPPARDPAGFSAGCQVLPDLRKLLPGKGAVNEPADLFFRISAA
jgi:hypothetical protein